MDEWYRKEMDRICLRAMAWERAKGELKSILHLYRDSDAGFDEYSNWLDLIIKDVEDNGIGNFT